MSDEVRSLADLEAEYDTLPISVMASVDAIIVYSNKAARDMLGQETLEGDAVYDYSAVREFQFLANFAGVSPVPIPGMVTRSTARRGNGDWLDIQTATRRVVFDGKEAFLHASVPLHAPDMVGELLNSVMRLTEEVNDLRSQMESWIYRDRLTKTTHRAALDAELEEDQSGT